MIPATLLQLIGILAVIGIFVIVFARPAGVLFVVLAVGIVVAAIVVSWHDVAQYHHQRAVAASGQQAIDAATAAAAAENAPAAPAHSGS